MNAGSSRATLVAMKHSSPQIASCKSSSSISYRQIHNISHIVLRPALVVVTCVSGILDCLMAQVSFSLVWPSSEDCRSREKGFCQCMLD